MLRGNEGVKLEWLVTFCEVARVESRVQAAEQLGITPGTVFKHLDKLGLWLTGGRRCPLVSGFGQVQLTAAGEEFLPYARQALEDIKKLDVLKAELAQRLEDRPAKLEAEKALKLAQPVALKVPSS